MSNFEGEITYPDMLIALHQLVGTEENLTDSLRRCADIARYAVPGTKGVGLTLRAGDSGTTVAFSGDPAPALDDAQYEDDLGPCLEAFRTDRTIYVERVSDELARWPTFVRRAEELGIRSSLSLPLRLKSDPVGALNLYADHEAAFSDETVEVAHMFAVQASIAVTNAQVYWRAKHLADNLTKALDSRDLIGQAKGILMREHGISSDDAFDRIRRVSQKRNIKVTALAEQIVWTGQIPNEESAPQER
ncbi:MAG: GAF and ANTAR domain-containing protein [Microthrixaceae bacterium]